MRQQVVSRSLFQTDSRFCTDGSSAADVHENSANQACGDGLEPDNHEDTADQEDADALEALLQDLNPSHTIHPYLDPPDVVLSSAPALESDSTVGTETSHSDWCDVFVDHFPFGHAGAPVSGLLHGSSVYEATRDNLRNSSWAPFQSQCD